MRNLKKVLALVLALVMALSLVTIASAKDASDFSDYGDITYKEAVDVMTAAGVFDGVGGNNFAPTNSLTREQAAKIVTYMLMGQANADKLVATIAPYSDVAADRWSAGSIAYCDNVGILAGVGDGRFNPTGELTGLAFAKMLLVALGYDAEIENLVGAKWAINTATLATATGLIENLEDVSLSEVLTREQACQMALNAMKTPLVEYENKGATIEVNGATVSFGAAKASYVTTTIAKTQTISDTQLSNSGAYTIEFAERYYQDLKLISDSTDDFDRPAHDWMLKASKIGTYVEDDTVSYTTEVKLSDIYKDLNLSKGVPAANIETYVDGLQVASLAISKTDETKIGANGTLTQVFYDSEDNTAVVTSINTYVATVAAVTAATSTADRFVTLSTKSTRANLNNKFETEDFAAKDLVSYTCAYNDTTKNYDIVAVEALEKSDTGILTAWNGINTGDSTSSFTANGTTYKYNTKAYIDVDGNPGAISAFKVDESELNVYCDQYGYALYVEGTEAAKDYAVVIGTGSSNQYGNETFGATLLLADGTQKEVTAKFNTTDNGTTLKLSAASTVGGTDRINLAAGYQNLVTDVVGDLVTYYVNKDGQYELTLTGLNAGKTTATGQWSDLYDTAGYTRFTNGRSLFALDVDANEANGNNALTAYATDKTLFFVATVNSSGKVVYNVYEGYKNMPSIDNTNATYGVAYALNSEYTTQLDAVFVSARSLKGLSADATFVVKQNNHEVVTDSTGSYFVMPAIIDGEVTTVKVDAKTLGADGAALDNVGTTQVTSVVSMSDVVMDKNDIYTGATFNAATPSDDFVNTKAYYTTSGLVAAANGVIGFGSSNKTAAVYWAYTKDTNFFEVSEDMKTITKVSATDLVTDGNDTVFFVADDDATASWKVVKTVIVQKNKDTVASGDTSITGLKVKNVAAAASTEVGVNYEVTIGSTANTDGVSCLDVAVATGASVTATKYATTLAGLATSPNAWPTTQVLGAGTYYVQFTVTAANGNTQDYVVKVNVGIDITLSITNARVVIDGKVYSDGDKVTAMVGEVISLQATKADGTTTLTVNYNSNPVSGYSGIYDITVVGTATTITVSAS